MESTLGKAKWKWLDSQDSKQLKWADQYLASRVAIIPAHASCQGRHAELTQYLANLPNNPASRELLGHMRAAWRQKEHRQQSDKKACNFILPTTTQANLKCLARSKKMTMTAALEELITEALAEEKHHKTELRGMKEEHKVKLDELKATQAKQIIKAEEQIKSWNEKVSAFDKAAKELGAEVCRLLREHCNKTLSTPQEEEDQAVLEDIYQEELAKIQGRLERATALGAFSERPHRHVSHSAGSRILNKN